MSRSLIVRMTAALVVLSALAAGAVPGAPKLSAEPALAATALPWQYKGYTLPVWDSNALNNADASLQQLASTGANSVTFVVTWYQSSLSSNDIVATGSTASDASLIHAMQLARSLGLQINLKPHVDSQDGLWRANISPTDINKWFTSYGNMMTHYADLLQQYGNANSVFVIGTELVTLSTNTTKDCAPTTWNSTNQWRSLISTLRGHFSGKLTYGANWGSGCYAEEFTRVPFWDALDYIGISAYFPVGDQGATPTVDSVKSHWSSWISSKIGPFQQQIGKPVMFTEVGYRSATGTAYQPFDAWSQWPLNTQEQVTCYEGFFAAWASIPWFVGISGWAWNVDTNVSSTDIWYEVQNKPALSTVKSWFSAGGVPSGTPTPVATPSAGPPSVTILNPLTNQTYSGTITVQAAATNAASVAFGVDNGSPASMSYDPSTGRWVASLDTAQFASGGHSVYVTNTGANGTAATDRAWSVQFSNSVTSPTSTPSAPPVPTATPMPIATQAATAAATATSIPSSGGPPSIQIYTPVSNGTYSGTITVQAAAANAASVAYAVDGGAQVPMSLNSSVGVWQASLDTTRLANGNGHFVDVINHGSNGATVTDRAWSVNIANTGSPSAPATAPTQTPMAAPTQTPMAAPTQTPVAAAGPPSIAIYNPLSNRTYTGTIAVQASATNANSVAYAVDNGAQVPMTFNASTRLWQASLDTTRLTNGNGHHVDVINHGSNGATVIDRAWSVNIAN